MWHKVAALSGSSAVALFAYQAHGFKPKDPRFTEVMSRATQFHLIHSLLLAAAPHANRPNLVGGLTLAGIVMFSGSCYAAAFTEKLSNARFAPVGGISFIAAWLALAL